MQDERMVGYFVPMHVAVVRSPPAVPFNNNETEVHIMPWEHGGVPTISARRAAAKDGETRTFYFSRN